jgi:hypothetical protein
MEPTLKNVLIPYEARRAVFSWLSAFDIAKLDLALGHILDERERTTYLNPVRDIIRNTAEMDALVKEGMELVACGSDTPLLYQRLQNTQKYLRIYGHKKRLQIYLVGMYPLRSGPKNALGDAILRFSINRPPDQDRILKDRQQLDRMLQNPSSSSFVPRYFLMSFGASLDGHLGHLKSGWFAEQNIPDATIDLKVYTPSYSDRSFGNIFIPRCELPGLFGLSRYKHAVWLFTVYARILADNARLPHMSYLTTSGLQETSQPLQDVDFRFRPLF